MVEERLLQPAVLILATLAHSVNHRHAVDGLALVVEAFRYACAWAGLKRALPGPAQAWAGHERASAETLGFGL